MPIDDDRCRLASAGVAEICRMLCGSAGLEAEGASGRGMAKPLPDEGVAFLLLLDGED